MAQSWCVSCLCLTVWLALMRTLFLDSRSVVQDTVPFSWNECKDRDANGPIYAGRSLYGVHVGAVRRPPWWHFVVLHAHQRQAVGYSCG
jgi:hypothetical protein